MRCLDQQHQHHLATVTICEQETKQQRTPERAASSRIVATPSSPARETTLVQPTRSIKQFPCFLDDQRVSTSIRPAGGMAKGSRLRQGTPTGGSSQELPFLAWGACCLRGYLLSSGLFQDKPAHLSSGRVPCSL